MSRKSNIGVAEANLGHFTDMQGYLKVEAPFAGVITLRNIDTGALVSDGSTLLFRIAQTDRLRTYVNVPQTMHRRSCGRSRPNLKIPDLPSRPSRRRSRVPPTRSIRRRARCWSKCRWPTRTGCFCLGCIREVNFTTPRAEPPLIIRADALVVRGAGNLVAVVGDDNVVHFKKVDVGRDFGDRIEVLGGLKKGERVVISPGDVVRENAKVNPMLVGMGSKT